MKTQNTFIIEVEKAIDFNNGFLNWNGDVVADIKEAQEYNEREEAEEAAGNFNITFGRNSGRIFARVI